MGEKQSQFEELLQPHLDSAYNVAFWLIQNDRDARAFVEEAYAQARLELDKLDVTDARVWLLKIVLRISHTWIQRQAHRSKMGTFPDDLSGKGKASPDPVTERISDRGRNELGKSYFEVLRRLPFEFREILVLHELEGWSYQQLAVGLGSTRDAVTRRLSVARRNLRRGQEEAQSG
jgi:RNA polymerase sigma factor (sigma-70 family)